MKLVRLVLSGFKSFADRTEITVDEGVTVIVGPNGCGKSNISDAVRWVLGEQNVRNLRGQKAEDIIFSGSETRKARNAAEVTLILDNSARELPLDAAEVSVSRRLYRNGDSEFYLNKRACRLKDIQELFANTGLGKGSLAIIGQNRVDQVLLARPEERRVIFEEVAGISRYRIRKEEGLRRLKATEDNLERVRDVTALLEEQLIPLKEGAEKARHFRHLTEKKKAALATRSLLRLSADRRMLARYENEYRTLTDEDTEKRTGLSQCDAEKTALEAEGTRLTDELKQCSEEASEAARAVEALRGQYRLEEESLRHLEEEEKRLLSEETASKSRAETLRQATKEKQAQTDEGTSRLDHLREALQGAREEEKQIKEALTKQERANQEKREARERLLAEKETLEKERVRLEEEEKRLKEAASELAKQQDLLNGSMASLREAQQKALAEKESLEEQGRKGRASLEEKKQVLQTVEEERMRAESSQREAAMRRNYLERMERDYASFGRTAKTILESRESFRSHVLGAAGELISVPEKYSTAAEIALGGALSHIVTDTAESAAVIISWLKEHHGGRTTFYPLDSLSHRESSDMERRAAEEKGICGIASRLFRAKPGAEKLLDFLLGRTLIAENLDAARDVSRRFGRRLRIVTLDGQLVSPGGSMTGGSVRKKENTYFGRKNEISRLKEEEQSLAARADALKEKERHLAEEAGEAEKELSAARVRWQEQSVEEAALQGKLEGLARTAENGAREMEREALLIKENEEARLRNGAAVKENSRHLEEMDASASGDADGEAEKMAKAADAAGEKVLSLHVEVTRAEENLVHWKEEALSLKGEIEEEERKKRDHAAAAAALEKEKTEKKAALEEIGQRFDERKKEEAALEKKRAGLEEGQAAFEVRRRANETAWRALQEKALSLQKALADRESRMESLKERIEGEKASLLQQNLTEASAEEIRLDGAAPDMERLLASLERDMADLGPVNPNGEKEYEEALSRRDFYIGQTEDLKRAEAGLEKVIREIDATMTVRFKEAFQDINEEFQRIVQIMFRGGSARLELTDEEKPLEGGVELFLTLPGKKRQPLTLMSGGERALTVIALLVSFLAYRPAPFCFVDEIDAALDDANVERFSRLIGAYKEKTQFIVISHRKKTMEFADTLQGVTMGEKGVSSLVTVRVGDYIEENAAHA